MEFNQVSCLDDGIYTLFGRCAPEFGALKFHIAVPPGTKFTRSQIQTIVESPALFNALLINDTITSRGTLLPEWAKAEDMTGDPVTESMDAGLEIPLFDSAKVHNMRTVKGGVCVKNVLARLKGAQEQFEFFEVYRSLDANYRYYIAGRRKWNATTGEYEMLGFKYDAIWSPVWKMASGNTKPQYTFKTWAADTAQYEQDMLFMPVQWNVGDLPTVGGVNLEAVKQATATFDVLATMACGGANLTEAYPALAAVGAWTCKNQLGNVVDITGVSIVNGKFRIVIDSVTPDADYTAGTHFKFSLKAISVTSASPYSVEYIESGYTTLIAK